jgi:hypothetical protein
MGAKKITAATTITPYEEQELSLDAIEVRPDLLQTRAGISREHVKAYAESIANGQSLPPVVIFRDDSGRLMLADGFHRVEANKRLGLRSIRAVIRDGTYQDALLYGIQANLATISHQPPNTADRKHAVVMMIRNGAGKPGEGTWDWSDTEIARRSGISAPLTKRIRMSLYHEESIPLPSRVITFDRSASPTGRTTHYLMHRKRSSYLPTITLKSNNDNVARIGGKKTYLGKDPQKAGEKLSSLIVEREHNRKYLVKVHDFQRWLTIRCIDARFATMQEFRFGGILIKDAVVLPIADSSSAEDVFQKFGHGMYIRAAIPLLRRLILVGYLRNQPNTAYLVKFAKDHALPVEFMTPEEVVAEFGPKGEPSHAGKWVAWSPDGRRIVAGARTLRAAMTRAVKAGHPRPIIEYIPRHLEPVQDALPGRRAQSIVPGGPGPETSA